MDRKKPGLKRGALLRIIMEESDLEKIDIAKIVSKEVNTVEKWLSGVNRLPEDAAKAITRSLKLPDDFFDRKISDLVRQESDYLSDRSVLIKSLSGTQIIVELSPSQLRTLVHKAYDLAADNARHLTDDDPPEPGGHQTD